MLEGASDGVLEKMPPENPVEGVLNIFEVPKEDIVLLFPNEEVVSPKPEPACPGAAELNKGDD